MKYRFKEAAQPAPERVPRIARLLALAHKFQSMLDSGEVGSMAELARLGRVSRARISQIMDLLLLAPEIQEEVLFGRIDATVNEMMVVAKKVVWADKGRVGRSAGKIVLPCDYHTRRN